MKHQHSFRCPLLSRLEPAAGPTAKPPYFEGWYLKHQNAGKTAAVIPAIHRDGSGDTVSSVQLVWDEGTAMAVYRHTPVLRLNTGLGVRIGASIFSTRGMLLNIDQDGIRATGRILYGAFTRPRFSLMGPLRYVPGLECRHDMISYLHRLSGQITINDCRYEFTGGTGYIETDCGRSFPKRYLWTQCSAFDGEELSIMAAAADVPLFGSSFHGTVCCVWYRGKEYRLASYLGAVLVKCAPDELIVSQAGRVLHVNRITQAPRTLRAPVNGSLTRAVEESVACTVRYRFYCAGRAVFDFTSSHASYECVQ